MFCPNCGTKNPEDGKFCRSCGADIGIVSAVMQGTLSQSPAEIENNLPARKKVRNAIRRRDPNEVYGDAVKNIISGIGFFIISIVLFTTGVAGGKAWWWAMLFPAFTYLAKGFSDLLKSRKMERSRIGYNQTPENLHGHSTETTALPPLSTDYRSPQSRFKTGDLVPPSSVTDHTTNQLEINSEGETITLPKR